MICWPWGRSGPRKDRARAEEFALTVKKQELPMHEPRGKQALSLSYATAPAGADHMRAPQDPAYEGFHPQGAHALEPLGLAEPLKRLEAWRSQGAPRTTTLTTGGRSAVAWACATWPRRRETRSASR